MKKLLSTTTLLLLSLVLSAQYSLSGYVKGGNGKPASDAKVILMDLQKKVLQSITTGSDGKFKFNRISETQVKVQVKHDAHETYEKTLDFSTKANLELTIALQYHIEIPDIEEEAEEISVMEVQSQKLSVAYNAAPAPMYYANGYVNHVGSAMDYNTESYDHIESNSFKSVKKEPLSTLSIDVDRASYSNVRRFINDGEMPPADAVRIEEMVNYFSYDYEAPMGNTPLAVTTTYTTCPWNENHELVHIGLKSKEIDMEDAPTNNLVFLLDVSGSMNYGNKLPLLKKGLALLVNEMRPNDKVSIVVYAGAAGVVLEPTTGKNKEKILAALEQLQAGGSTAGGAGIKLAYKLAKDNFMPNGNNRVILATDGDFNVGASSDGEMVELIESKRNDGIFLTVLGFGTGNLKDSKMEKLADHGNGNYAYIDNILEAKKTLVKEMGGTLITVAKDVKFQLEFNPAHVKEYRLIGYENRLLDAEDFNDDKKDAGELGAGHCVTAIYEIIPAGSSESNADVDPLKYQSEHENTTASHEGELLTVKVRYKLPKEDKSTKLEIPVPANRVDFSKTNQDVQFSAAVAAYGMILRNSEHKGKSTYEMVMDIARGAKGEDRDGYRAAFIQMVDMTSLLDKRDS
jgi:Ca-activated chloride channel family protein